MKKGKWLAATLVAVSLVLPGTASAESLAIPTARQAIRADAPAIAKVVHFQRCRHIAANHVHCRIWVYAESTGGDIVLAGRVYWGVDVFPNHVRWHD